MIKKMTLMILFVSIFGCAYRETPPAPIADGIAQFAAGGTTTTTAAVVAPADAVKTSPTKLTKLSKMNKQDSNTKHEPASHPKKSVQATASKPVSANDNDDTTDDKASLGSTTRDGWMMPSIGEIVGKFSQAKKGLDIKAVAGSPVYAASDGKVVYSGNGLKGYGNLIIIRHDNGYLTAYAQNKTNLVKVGQDVKCGDKIAQVGSGGILHFELRKNGKPINPTDYISGK